MRDLSIFDAACFDIVCQPYSLNFVPDCREVFAQVARVLRLGGIYSFWAANPFAAGLGTRAWNGRGYEIQALYEQGVEFEYEDEAWLFPAGSVASKPARQREYRQLLSTLVNALIGSGFTLLHMKEETGHAPVENLIPGEWDHFTAVIPPWLSFLARLDGKAVPHDPLDWIERNLIVTGSKAWSLRFRAQSSAARFRLKWRTHELRAAAPGSIPSCLTL